MRTRKQSPTTRVLPDTDQTSEQRWVADADRETNSGWAVGDGIYRILWRVIDVRLILSSVI